MGACVAPEDACKPQDPPAREGLEKGERKQAGPPAPRPPRKSAQQAAHFWNALEDKAYDEEAEPAAQLPATLPAAPMLPNCDEGAKAAKEQVVWARVKGYPFWPAQIMDSKAAAKRKDLAGAKRNKEQSMPVMFFGTLEVAWQAPKDVRSWQDGLGEGLLGKANKYKASFTLAIQQVKEFLALSEQHRAPKGWWCAAPKFPTTNDAGQTPDLQKGSAKSVKATGNGAGACKAKASVPSKGKLGVRPEGKVTKPQAQKSDLLQGLAAALTAGSSGSIVAEAITAAHVSIVQNQADERVAEAKQELPPAAGFTLPGLVGSGASLKLEAQPSGEGAASTSVSPGMQSPYPPTVLGAAPRRRTSGASRLRPRETIPGDEAPVDPAADPKIKRPKYVFTRRNIWSHDLQRNKRKPKDDIQVCNCRPAPQAQDVAFASMNGSAENSSSEAQPVEPPTNGGANSAHPGSYAKRTVRAPKAALLDPGQQDCGERCFNRQAFHSLPLPKMEVFHTGNRGWGVRAASVIEAGSFVVEYAGELISLAESQRRTTEAAQSGQYDFYMMELTPGIIIDARLKGNLARLLNSSCDPNCETQKWHDAATGEVRIGIFTKEDILPGAELTYDYKFQHSGLASQAGDYKCQCGAASCRGTMDTQPERLKDYGKRIEIFWEGDQVYYRGTVTGYSLASRKHTVRYDDGDVERVGLEYTPHRWLQEDAAEHAHSIALVGALEQPFIMAAQAPAPKPSPIKKRKLASLPGSKRKKAAISVPVVATSAASGAPLVADFRCTAPGGLSAAAIKVQPGSLGSILLPFMKAEAANGRSMADAAGGPSLPEAQLVLHVDEADVSVAATIEAIAPITAAPGPSASFAAAPSLPSSWAAKPVHLLPSHPCASATALPVAAARGIPSHPGKEHPRPANVLMGILQAAAAAPIEAACSHQAGGAALPAGTSGGHTGEHSQVAEGNRSADGKVRGADGKVRGADREMRGADGELQGADIELQGADGELRRADGALRGADIEMRGADGELRGTDGELQGADGNGGQPKRAKVKGIDEAGGVEIEIAEADQAVGMETGGEDEEAAARTGLKTAEVDQAACMETAGEEAEAAARTGLETAEANQAAGMETDGEDADTAARTGLPTGMEWMRAVGVGSEAACSETIAFPLLDQKERGCGARPLLQMPLAGRQAPAGKGVPGSVIVVGRGTRLGSEDMPRTHPSTVIVVPP